MISGWMHIHVRFSSGMSKHSKGAQGWDHWERATVADQETTCDPVSEFSTARSNWDDRVYRLRTEM